jgi:hypothetical protein
LGSTAAHWLESSSGAAGHRPMVRTARARMERDRTATVRTEGRHTGFRGPLKTSPFPMHRHSYPCRRFPLHPRRATETVASPPPRMATDR